MVLQGVGARSCVQMRVPRQLRQSPSCRKLTVVQSLTFFGAVQGSLLDVYARADITALCRSNAYNRLQWEDVTVGQALALGVSATSDEAPPAAH